MQRICLGLTLLLGLGFFSPLIQLRAENLIEVHGHRGARAREPENTLPAFERALSAGADVLELDLGVSRDGFLVLNHDISVNTDLCFSNDRELRRLSHPLVHSLTLSQLKTFDCGSAYDKNFPKRNLRPGTRLLSFREFLRWLNASANQNVKNVRLNIETKIEPEHPHWTLSPQVFVDLIAKDLRDFKISPQRIIIQSFDFRSIVYVKDKYPEYQTSALVEERPLNVESIWQKTKADYLSPDAGLLSRRKILEARRFGMKVVPWTLNNSFLWSHFIGMGVDGIITDDPAALVNYLKRKNKKPKRRKGSLTY